MIKANFNTYANYVTDSLYQWDLNQELAISGLNLSVAPEIHFSNANMDRAIVRQSALDNGVVKVNIPNSLLQEALTIKVHIGVYEGDTFNIIETVEIPVYAKARPSDYTLTNSDEEIYSFNKLENEIANAKKDFEDLSDANFEDMRSYVNENTEVLNARIDNIIAHNNDTEGNTELLDLRVGADGTVYESAGSAVRGQVNNLKSDLSEYRAMRLHYKIIENEYISSNEEKYGGVPQAYNGWDRTDFIECDGYDYLYIKTNGTHKQNNAFYDANKVYIPSSLFYIGGSTDFCKVPVPQGAKYFILSDEREVVSSFVIKSNTGHMNDVLNEYVANTDLLNRNLIFFGTTKDKYVRKDTGLIEKYSNWSATDYIDISMFDNVTVVSEKASEYNYYYDSEKTPLKQVSVGVGKTVLQIPNNAVYVAFSNETAVIDNMLIIREKGMTNEQKEILDSKTSLYPECYLLRKEIPSYYTEMPSNPTSFEDDSYIDSKINSIPYDKPSFIFVTDMHYPSNAKNSLLLMPYIKNRLGINTVIHGGDVLDYDESNKYKAVKRLREWAYDMRSALGSSLLPVQGNHDINTAGIRTDSLDKLDASFIPYSVAEKVTLDGCRKRIVQETDKAITDRIAKLGVTIADEDKEDVYAWYKLHYYSDDAENKTRYIVLEQGNTYNVQIQKYFGVSQPTELRLQMEWFYETLLSTPKDYNIVVASHVFINWNYNQVTNYPTLQLVKMLSLLKQGTSGTVKFADYVTTTSDGATLETKDVTVDFTDNKQNGKIVCVCGDAHWDFACICHTASDGTYKSETYSDTLEKKEDDILVIMTQSDAIRACNYDMSIYPSYSVQHTMAEGTITEQCFDVITLKDDSVVCTRIGAGVDRVFNY